MDMTIHEEDSRWRELAPHLDQALDRLGDDQRHALLLRYFEQKPYAEVGLALAISEDAAKMRVSRALEKLRELLAAERIALSAAALAALLQDHATEAAPAEAAARLAMIRPATVTPVGTDKALPYWKFGMAAGLAGLLITGLVLATRIPRKSSDQSSAADVPSKTVAAETPSRAALPSAALNRRVQSYNPVTTRTRLKLVDSESGLPIANARIRMAYFYAGGVREVHNVRSGVDGIAAIPFPDREGDHGANVFVTADEYVPKVISWKPDTFPEEYLMRLDPALSLAGHVMNETGEPIAGVKIKLQDHGVDTRKAENVAFNSPETASLSEVTGAFRFPYVPRDWKEARLILTADGYAVTETNIDLTSAQMDKLQLLIRSGAIVTGRVVDPDGQPVAGAEVKEVQNFGWQPLSARTGPEGNFTLTGVFNPLAPEIELVVQAGGLASQAKTVSLVARTNHVDFKLQNSVPFRGRILDEDGIPIAEATVRTDSNNQGIRKYEWLDYSDVDGRFEWEEAPREEVLFWFEKAGYETIRELPLTPATNEFTITLRKIGSTRPLKGLPSKPKVTYRFYEGPQ